MQLSKEHFYICNEWYLVDYLYEKRYRKAIQDQNTQDIYRNEQIWLIRGKCFILSIITPIVHTIAATGRILYLCSNLLLNPNAKFNDILYKICYALACILLLECAALYGLISPYDGRKLYSSLELSNYEWFRMAPCFQRLHKDKIEYLENLLDDPLTTSLWPIFSC